RSLSIAPPAPWPAKGPPVLTAPPTARLPVKGQALTVNVVTLPKKLNAPIAPLAPGPRRSAPPPVLRVAASAAMSSHVVVVTVDGAAVGLTDRRAAVPGDRAAAGADRPVADERAADDRGRRIPVTIPDGAALGVSARGPADGLVADEDGIGDPQHAVLVGDAT